MSEFAHPHPQVSDGLEKEQRLSLIQQEAAELVPSRVQLPIALSWMTPT